MLYDDPVLQLALLFYVVLFILALLPSRQNARASGPENCGFQPLLDPQAICRSSDVYRFQPVPSWRTIDHSFAFPELERSWAAQCCAWLRRALERIQDQ
jgi:hypothetical protein